MKLVRCVLGALYMSAVSVARGEEAAVWHRLQQRAAPPNLSDAELMVPERGWLREQGRAARSEPHYHDPAVRHLKAHTLDLMKQAIYGTQARMGALEPVAARFSRSVPFQMAFVFGRLEQLVVDLRRVYTLAKKRRARQTLAQHVLLYEHAARKHVDVLYLLQHVIDMHLTVMQAIEHLLPALEQRKKVIKKNRG